MLILVFLVSILLTTDGLRSIPKAGSIIGLVIGLAALIGAGFTAKGYLKARKLDQFGAITEGTIIDSWCTEDSDGDKTYYIAYQFGDDVRVRQMVKEHIYQTLFTGTKVTVRYLPDDPICSRMEP